MIKTLKSILGAFRIYKEEDPMDEIHKKMAEELYGVASMTLAESGTIYPIFYLIKGRDYMPVIIDPEGPPVDTVTYASVVNSAAQDQDCDAAIFISEQWTVIGKPSDEEMQKYIDGTKRPSEAEGRRDFLNLVYISAKGVIKSLTGEIKTSGNGIHYVEESEWMDDAHTNILTPWR